MFGKIKHYATKYDINYGLEHQHDATIADLTELYNARLIWGNNTLITDEGITDETHKVVQSINMETREPETYQLELIVDEHAYVYNVLGYTDEEILEILNAN